MTLTNVIKILVSFFILTILVHKSYAQEIKKEKIYILFKKNDDTKPKFRGKKFVNNLGINFNLIEKGAFLHNKKMIKDTLCIDKLNNYTLTNETEIEKKASLWKKKNEEKLKKKYGVLYRQATEYKNNIFDIYIIEKINPKQIVLYQVKFKNEGVIK